MTEGPRHVRIHVKQHAARCRLHQTPFRATLYVVLEPESLKGELVHVISVEKAVVARYVVTPFSLQNEFPDLALILGDLSTSSDERDVYKSISILAFFGLSGISNLGTCTVHAVMRDGVPHCRSISDRVLQVGDPITKITLRNTAQFEPSIQLIDMGSLSIDPLGVPLFHLLS